MQRRLDTTCEQLADTYTALIKACRIDIHKQLSNRTEAELDSYELSARAAVIVRLAETLFTLLAEVKDALFSADPITLHGFVEERKKTLRCVHEETNRFTTSLERDISMHLTALEDCYYDALPLL